MASATSEAPKTAPKNAPRGTSAPVCAALGAMSSAGVRQRGVRRDHSRPAVVVGVAQPGPLTSEPVPGAVLHLHSGPFWTQTNEANFDFGRRWPVFAPQLKTTL